MKAAEEAWIDNASCGNVAKAAAATALALQSDYSYYVVNSLFPEREPGTADPENAVQHATWSCLLTQALGSEEATRVTDAHEEGEEDTPDSQMDQHNNQVGRELAGELGGTCQERAIEALGAGRLQTDPAIPVP